MEEETSHEPGFDFYKRTANDATAIQRVTLRTSGHRVLAPAAVELMGEGVPQVHPQSTLLNKSARR
jgi:hypothetical protein